MYTNPKQIFIGFITCDIKQDQNIHEKRDEKSNIENMEYRHTYEYIQWKLFSAGTRTYIHFIPGFNIGWTRTCQAGKTNEIC